MKKVVNEARGANSSEVEEEETGSRLETPQEFYERATKRSDIAEILRRLAQGEPVDPVHHRRTQHDG